MDDEFLFMDVNKMQHYLLCSRYYRPKKKIVMFPPYRPGQIFFLLTRARQKFTIPFFCVILIFLFLSFTVLSFYRLLFSYKKYRLIRLLYKVIQFLTNECKNIFDGGTAWFHDCGFFMFFIAVF